MHQFKVGDIAQFMTGVNDTHDNDVHKGGIPCLDFQSMGLRTKKHLASLMQTLLSGAKQK